MIDETLALESSSPSSTRDKILEQIRNNPKITRNELASILGIPPLVLNITFKKWQQKVLLFVMVQLGMVIGRLFHKISSENAL